MYLTEYIPTTGNKMIRFINIVFLLVWTLTAIQTTVFADEARMKNGDRITGTVVKLKDGILTLKTSYAGILAIDWKKVEGLQTDRNVDILLRDESLFSAPFADSGNATAEFRKTDGNPHEKVDLNDILAINPDRPGPAMDFSGRINAGISVTDGNTKQSAFSSDGELTARTVEDRWTLGWRIKQEKTEGRKTADRIYGNAEYDHFLTQKWYMLTNIAGERDKINNLDLRFDMGVGTGYQFIETETDKLSAEVGISQVAEDFEHAANPKYFALRWAVDANFLLGETGLEIFHQHTGLLSFENIQGLIIKSVTGFRIPVYNQFSSTIQINWDWVNQPGESLRNSDVDYLLALEYKF